MHFFGLSLAIQLACAIHCLRNRANRMWLTIILFLSVPGCLAYLILDVLPRYGQRREVRFAKQVARRKLDPEREIQLARWALEEIDTAAARAALGDALAENRVWGEAVEHYERALAMTPSDDRTGKVKLANALVEDGQANRARELLENLPPSFSDSEIDRANLLLGRALEDCGEVESALALYEEVGRRMPGAEAQCRRAALLIRQGRKQEALSVLLEIERLAQRLDRFQRAEHADMYQWAKTSLTELKATAP